MAADAYLAAIGGAANVVDIDACITRLRLTLKDRSQVDQAAVKALGAEGIVPLGSRNMQIILGPKAELVCGAIKQRLAQATAPSPVDNHANEQTLLAVADGEIVDLEQVPDQVFASRLAGDGIAIQLQGSRIVAPCDGKLEKIFATNHAFALKAASGASCSRDSGAYRDRYGGAQGGRL